MVDSLGNPVPFVLDDKYLDGIDGWIAAVKVTL
jgi:hypothetical protein